MEIGFIGIGRMGSRMAARLLGAGHALAIHDPNRAACEALAKRGAQVCDAPDAVARASDVVITSLPGPEEVAQVLEGERGVLPAARKGCLIIETSTIGPAQSRALAKRCAELGLSFVDAPVSNGVPAAEAGELTIMVGGTKAQYERALPILEHLGTTIYHMGPTGSGNIAKVSNQVIYLSYVAVFCEIAKLGREAGMDVSQLIDCMRRSVAGAPLMTHWEDRLENGDRAAGFAIERLLKDMDLCGEIFRERGVSAPVFESARRTYREVAEAGGEHLDMTAIYSR